jgi:hypothetical protein
LELLFWARSMCGVCRTRGRSSYILAGRACSLFSRLPGAELREISIPRRRLEPEA